MSNDHPPTVDMWNMGVHEVKARVPIRMYSIPNFRENEYVDETIDVATLDERRGTGVFIYNTEHSDESQPGEDATTLYDAPITNSRNDAVSPSTQNNIPIPLGSPIVTELSAPYEAVPSRHLPQYTAANPPPTASAKARALSNAKPQEIHPPPSKLDVNGCELLVCRKVGSGGYSECYQVRSRTGRDFVAKFVVLKKLKNGKTTADTVQREFRIHRRVRHPNILRLWDLIECEQHLALILEFCPQGTLQELVKHRGAMTEPAALQNFAHILSAVDYLHERHIHHADLKLSNILLNSLMQPVIADFGFAREIPNDRFIRRHPCGTPWYMAPEIVKSPCRFGLPSDIWALGVILFNLLYGRPVFNSRENHVVYDRIKKYDVRFPPLKTVSPALVLYIRAMLTPRPELRPNSRDLMRTLLVDSGGHFCGDVSPYLPSLHPLPSEKRLIPAVLSWKANHNPAPQRLVQYMIHRDLPTSYKSNQPTSNVTSPPPSPNAERKKVNRKSLPQAWNSFWSKRLPRLGKREKSLPVET